MPPSPFHNTNRVIYDDTDSGGVVYHATYLRFFEIGRTEMIRHWNSPYINLINRGFILPVTECYIRYKAPGYYDDLLITETALVKVKKISCRFNYRIVRAEKDNNQKEKLIAQGFTAHACVDPQGKLTPFPDDFAELLEKIMRAQEEK